MCGTRRLRVIYHLILSCLPKTWVSRPILHVLALLCHRFLCCRSPFYRSLCLSLGEGSECERCAASGLWGVLLDGCWVATVTGYSHVLFVVICFKDPLEVLSGSWVSVNGVLPRVFEDFCRISVDWRLSLVIHTYSLLLCVLKIHLKSC